MIKQWRNITLLKQSGLGHDPAGIHAAMPGACAVLCPACPQPGKNMPDDWQTTPPEVRYAIHLCFSARY